MHSSLRRVCGAALSLALLLGIGAPAASAAPSSAESAAPVAPRVEPSARSVFVVYEDDTISSADFRDLREEAGADAVRARVVGRNRLSIARMPKARAEALAARLRGLPGVAHAAAMSPVKAVGLPVQPDDRYYLSDNYGRTQYGQRTYLGTRSSTPYSINAEPAWDRAFNGERNELHPDAPAVTVAVIDTGIKFGYRENPGTVIGGYDYVNDDNDPADDNWSDGGTYHGTRVASVIKSQADNGFGIAGVARGTKVRLLAYKVLDQYGLGDGGDALEALYAAVDSGARVVNCSFSGPMTSTYEQNMWNNAVAYARSKGTLVVAASGNSSTSSTLRPVGWPAAARGVLAVGAYNPQDGTKSTFSDGGPQLDLAAPGQDIWGASPSDSLARLRGTSFSSPLAAGSAAFLLSLVPRPGGSSPSAWVDYISSVMTQTATPAGAEGFDAHYGWGRLDLWAAYQRLIADIPQASPPSGLRVTMQDGIIASLTWNSVGSGAAYRYGYVGGPEYTTTATSAKLPLGGSGTFTVYVKSYSPDRWNDDTTSTIQVFVGGSRGPITSERYGSADRYATAIAASKATFPNGSTRVVVASADTWPDALSAGVLAAKANAPLLLTAGTSLPFSVRDELVRLNPSTVYVVGGTATISDSVSARIGAVASAGVTRIAGPDRYSTAGLVADRVRALQGGAIPDRRAIVVSGENYPDALSAGPLAARRGWPILLTPSGWSNNATKSAISRNGIRSTIVVGGAKSVTPKAYAALPSPTRIAGSDRYDASRRLADYAYARGWLTGGDIGLATGRTFTHPLSAAGTLGARGGVLVLADGLDMDLEVWLFQRGARFESVDLFGPVTLDMEQRALKTLRP